MGTEILRPQDCLGERFRVAPSPFHRRKNHFPNGNGYFNHGYQKKRFNNQQQRHQEVNNGKRLASADDFKATRHSNNNNYNYNRSDSHNRNGNTNIPGLGPGPGPSPGPVVSILRRGESLDSLNSKIKRDNKTTPSQKMEQKADVYAGSAFSVSPSPSSVPLPSFFRKKELKSVDDSATRDLRRLLRLE